MCMDKPPPARHRRTNWSSYNASLRKRGSLSIWMDKRHPRRRVHPSRDGDESPVLADLLHQIPEDEPIIPIRRNGRFWKEECPTAKVRNETLRATRHYDRTFCERSAGYHARRRIEARMRGLKSFGVRIMAVHHCRSDQ